MSDRQECNENIPFYSWTPHQSRDPNKPDLIDIRLISTEFWASDKTDNITVEVREGINWLKYQMPVKGHDSTNAQLKKLFEQGIAKGTIKEGTYLTIALYRRKSKRNPDREPKQFRFLNLH